MKPAARIAWIVLGAVALVVVAVVAYSIGTTNGHGPDGIGVMSFRGMAFGRGWGWLGLLFPALLVGLGVLFVLALVGEPRRGAPPPPSYLPPYPPAYQPGDAGPMVPPPGDDGVTQLRQLAELHAQGHLTDEEFVAAKRKLLGL